MLTPALIKQQTLQFHHQWREIHLASRLEWSDDCCEAARLHAEACSVQGRVFKADSTLGKYGQNIWAGRKGAPPEEAIEAWYRGQEEYDFEEPYEALSESASQFTQLVWSSTTHVGLAISKDELYIVANYWPAGNQDGHFEANVHEAIHFEKAAELVAGSEVEKIGMFFSTLPPKALVVKKVLPGSWAAQVGIHVGDMFMEVNGIPVHELTPEKFREMMAERPLSLKLPNSSQHTQVVKLQRLFRGRLAKEEVARRKKAKERRHRLTNIGLRDRYDVMMAVFKLLDQSQEGRLTEPELLRFMRMLGHVDVDEDMSEIYPLICEAYSIKPDDGLSSAQFIKMVNDQEDDWYRTDAQLDEMYEELEFESSLKPRPGRRGEIGRGVRTIVIPFGVLKKGMTMSVPPSPLMVKTVLPDSWADKVGLEVGDTFMEVNGIPVYMLTTADFRREMKKRPLTLRLVDDDEVRASVKIQTLVRMKLARKRSSEEVQAPEILCDIFRRLDENKDELLDGKELLVLVRSIEDYPGSDEEWFEDFEELCQDYGFEAESGLTLKQFMRFFHGREEEQSIFYCTVAHLREFLRRLELNVEKDHVAATKLQSMQRGRMARKEVEEKRLRESHAATKIQSLQRGRVSRKETEEKRLQLNLEDLYSGELEENALESDVTNRNSGNAELRRVATMRKGSARQRELDLIMAEFEGDSDTEDEDLLSPKTRRESLSSGADDGEKDDMASASSSAQSEEWFNDPEYFLHTDKKRRQAGAVKIQKVFRGNRERKNLAKRREETVFGKDRKSPKVLDAEEEQVGQGTQKKQEDLGVKAASVNTDAKDVQRQKSAQSIQRGQAARQQLATDETLLSNQTQQDAATRIPSVQSGSSEREKITERADTAKSSHVSPDDSKPERFRIHSSQSSGAIRRERAAVQIQSAQRAYMARQEAANLRALKREATLDVNDVEFDEEFMRNDDAPLDSEYVPNRHERAMAHHPEEIVVDNAMKQQKSMGRMKRRQHADDESTNTMPRTSLQRVEGKDVIVSSGGAAAREECSKEHTGKSAASPDLRTPMDSRGAPAAAEEHRSVAILPASLVTHPNKDEDVRPQLEQVEGSYALELEITPDDVTTSSGPLAAKPQRTRSVILADIFQFFDLDRDGKLQQAEMFHFARAIRFPGSEDDWAGVFSELCSQYGLDELGLDQESFMDLLSEESDAMWFFSDDELEAVLDENAKATKIQKIYRGVKVRQELRNTFQPRDEQELGEVAHRASLINQLFANLDVDQDYALNERELYQFVRCFDFPGTLAEWGKVYHEMCVAYDWEPEVGIDLGMFHEMVNDDSESWYATNDDLVLFLQRLEAERSAVLVQSNYRGHLVRMQNWRLSVRSSDASILQADITSLSSAQLWKPELSIVPKPKFGPDRVPWREYRLPSRFEHRARQPLCVSLGVVSKKAKELRSANREDEQKPPEEIPGIATPRKMWRKHPIRGVQTQYKTVIEPIQEVEEFPSSSSTRQIWRKQTFHGVQPHLHLQPQIQDEISSSLTNEQAAVQKSSGSSMHAAQVELEFDASLARVPWRKPYRGDATTSNDKLLRTR